MSRHRAGTVTVSVSGFDEWLDRILVAAQEEAKAVLDDEATKIVQSARAAWYGPDGVERETGRSGDIVKGAPESTRSAIRIFVGSTDTRVAGKSRKPIPYFVHRPRATSTVSTEVSRATWYATPDYRRGPIMLGDEVYRPREGVRVPAASLRYLIHADNPTAGDGKYLVPELLTKPTRAARKAVAATLAARIVKRVS